MPNKRVYLTEGEYYHTFNRGIASQPTFLTKQDYNQALLSMEYYRFSNPNKSLSRYKFLSQEEKHNFLSNLRDRRPLVEIVAYVFMTNHFHFLLKQSLPSGISKFISQFSNSYTRYFNTKNHRSGPIFQGIFKAVHIENQEQLIHVSRYIHLNPVVSNLIPKSQLTSYPWSSLPEYLGPNHLICTPNIVLDNFSSTDDYLKFLNDHIDYARQLEYIKHFTLDS